MMFIGTLVFNLIPGQMLRVFTSDPQVITIGMVGFHFVGISFIPMVTSLIFPVFFQAVGAAVKSSLLLCHKPPVKEHPDQRGDDFRHRKCKPEIIQSQTGK